VERTIGCLFDTVRALLQQAKQSPSFWPLAMYHAVYLRNRLPTKALGGRVPMQQLTGSMPDLTHLRMYGCKAFVKVDDAARKSLDSKAREAVYIGHSDLSNSFRVLVRGAKGHWDIVDTIHCTFDERAVGSQVAKASAKQGVSAPATATTTPSSKPTATSMPASHLPLLASKDPLLDDFDDGNTPAVSQLVLGGSGSEPSNYKQAMQTTDAVSWRTAVQSEIDSLIDNGTFEEVQGNVRGKLLTTRWVFTRKDHETDPSRRYKARLVARGDHQREGIDYDVFSISSPVTTATTVRAVLSVAAHRDYHIDQLDVKTAFLNADLNEELYLRVPDGYTPGNKATTALRLRKSLYGLKQAPHEWNKLLSEWLRSQGLQQSSADQCLFFIPNKLWVVFWVDDFLVVSVDAAVKDAFKTALAARFKLRDLGPVQQFLGMSITRDRKQRKLTVSSTAHIDAMLQRYNMADARPAPTPLEHMACLRARTDGEERLHLSVPYRGAVGSLLYVAMWTRPDIAFAVSQVARFQADPSVYHWECVKRIFRYLKGTRLLGLTFSGGPAKLTLKGYVDASWGEDLDTRCSQSAYVFMLGNAAISWKSKLQRLVALSSTEAEYISLCTASCEALYLRKLLGDICPDASGPVTLYEDNQSTIKQASSLLSSDRSKHMDIKYRFIKQHVANGDICLEYIPTADQPADALTRSLDRIKANNRFNPPPFPLEAC